MLRLLPQSGPRAAITLGPMSQVAIVIGVVVPCLALAGWALDIKTLRNVLPGQPQMAPNTALAFILTSVSLWLLRTEESAARRRRHARACAGAVTLMGLLTLGEYLSGLDLKIDTLLFSDSPRGAGASFPGRPSPHTALSFLLVVMSNTRGGHMARHMLPPAVLVPIALGGLIIRGTRAGLYDAAFGMSLCVVASIITLGVLVWRNAKTLYRVDAGRKRAERALR